MTPRARQIALVVDAFGWRGIARRAAYAASLRSGVLRRRLPRSDYATSPPITWTFRFDLPSVKRRYDEAGLTADGPMSETLANAQRLVDGEVRRYGWLWTPAPSSTRWATNPFTGHTYPPIHWTGIDDDDASLGDIKDVWEPSRLGCTFLLARAWAVSGDDRFVDTWWQTLERWVEANPPNTGVNWRCAQEASLRGIAVSFGLSVFAEHPASTARRADLAYRLLGATVERVRPTLGYALSQRNNHAISELSFLLSIPGDADLRLSRLLRDAIRDQFLDDGSYSQQSFVYQRLAVHTLVWLLEVQPHLPRDLRRTIADALSRSAVFLERCSDPVSGHWPNHGHNDGTLLLDLGGDEHLDARPTLALLGVDVRSTAADEVRCWFEPIQRASTHPDSNGTTFHTVRGERSLLLTRLGLGRHRAVHDDQQALELFLDGARAVIDPGTYRYTDRAPWGNPFAGSEVHSGLRPTRSSERATMGRFLREPMPAARIIARRSSNGVDTLVSRRDEGGTQLTRSIVRSGDRYAVIDTCTGGEGIIRWNLRANLDPACFDIPGARRLGPRNDAEPDSGWWSPSYGQLEPCDAFEVRVTDGGRTIARFAAAGQRLLTVDQIEDALGLTPDQADRSVLVLNHFAQPRSAPGGTRHVELFSRLPGWRARVITSNRNQLTGEPIHSDEGLETVWTSRYRGNGPGRIVNWISYAVTSFWRGARVRPLDVVYGSSPHLLAGLSACLIAAVRRKPFVLEIRDLWPKVLVDMHTMSADSRSYRLLERLETFLYRRAQVVVILAEGVRGHIEQRGVAPERIVCIPNGADPADMTSASDRSELREHYGFAGVVALYAGAHGPANGLDLLLDAAKDASDRVPQLLVVLVGDGADKARLVRRAADEQLSNVRFMEPVPKSEMPDLLSAADVGVHCLADVELFRTGVSPNKLFDYMAAGRAVITNTPGVCSDYVEASDGGISVSPRGLGDGLVRLAQLDDDERAALGASGRAHLAATQSRTAMAARLAALLNDLFSAR